MASAPETLGGGDDRSEAAYRIFEAVRWPDGVVSCPHCGLAGRCRYLAPSGTVGRRTRTGHVSVRRVWRCNDCRRQFSVLTGTVFEGTRVPLSSWLDALACIPSGRASARRITAVTGVRPDTARSMARLIDAGLMASRSAGQRQG